MKKYLVLFISFGFFLCAEAQNVGIGTDAPLYQLDVKGRMRIKTGEVNMLATSSGIWYEDYRDGTNRIFAGMQDSIRWGLWGAGVGGTGWQFNFNAKTGGVGIGMDNKSSAARLQLNDADGAGVELYKNNEYRGKFKATDSTLEIQAAVGSSLCFPQPCTPLIPKNLILQPAPTGISVAIVGNVGIGSNNPSAKLQVGGNVMVGIGEPAAGYMLSVNGKIICTEARVQLKTGWPDYVFSNAYKLRSLDEVEQFIKTNKHLPNIPSAKEVENENGFDIGDIQKRLLEKVEELTLYLIDMKKENESLKRRVQALENK